MTSTDVDINDSLTAKSFQNFTQNLESIRASLDEQTNYIDQPLNRNIVSFRTAFININAQPLTTMKAITTQLYKDENIPLLAVKNSPNYLSLKQKFAQELINKDIKNDFVNTIFERLAIELYKIHYREVYIEITSRNSLKFTFDLYNSNILMVSRSMDREDENENVVIFSFFHNKELIVSDVSEVTELVKGITELPSVQVL